MAGARWRRAVSEGLLLLTVVDKLKTEQSQTGGNGRGVWSAWSRAVGEGPDDLLQERRAYRDVTWREMGEDFGLIGE